MALVRPGRVAECLRTAAWMALAAALVLSVVPDAPTTAASAAPHPHGSSRVWQADWIWDRPPVPERNAYTYFRKEFTLSGPATGASASITADSRYQLFVNGRFIGRGPVRAEPRFQSYDTYDLVPFLQSGPNVVAAVVHFFGESNEQYLLGRGAFLFEAGITTAAALPLTVKSDSTWQALRSSAWNVSSTRENESNGFTEIYDARLEPVGWTRPGFDGSAWAVPFVIGRPPQAPWSSLVPRDIPFLYERDLKPMAVVQVGEVARNAGADPMIVAAQVKSESVDPATTVSVANVDYLVSGSGSVATVTTTAPNRDAVIVLDLGRVVSGYPFVSLDGAAGTIVDVSFSEWLDGNRVTPVKAPVRFEGFEGPSMYTADRITLRQGPFRWQRFFHSGLRYIQLTVRDAAQPVRIGAAGAAFTSYPYALRGRFRSSDDLLSRIWNVGAYTVLVNSFDVFTDCPWREKGQWMDMPTPLVSYNAFGDQAIAARYLRSTAQSENSGGGRLFFPYPSFFSFELPDQTMWWGMHLWQYHLHFGDPAVVADLYPTLVRLNAWFQAHLSPRGSLLASWPNDGPRVLWPWIDHGHRVGANTPGLKLGEMAALDALYYKFLLDAANLARAVGRVDDASAFDAQSRLLKDRINANYWDATAGIYWDDPARTIRGEQASVLAVLYGIAPPDQWTRILNGVMDADFKVGDSSPHFYFFILDALAKAGMYDRALDTIRARWGDMLAQGATTWWEGWKFDVDFFGQPWRAGEQHNLSLAHGYGAAPTYFLTTLALGVRPVAPGFSRFLVAPNPGTGLDWAEGAVPSPRGTIPVSWARGSQIFSLALTVPAGTVATVSVPRMPLDEIVSDGVVVWRGGPVPPGDARLRIYGSAQGRVHMDAQPGAFALVSR